jgi:superfamily II DNA or RNA helicase
MAEDPKFSLDTTSLRKRLGEVTYARAREVYVLQKVRDGYEAFCSGSQDWHFIGVVQGSNRELYEVEVDAEITPWGEITALKTECTCPAPSPCKHAGALMLKAAYREGTVLDGSRSRQAAPKFPILPGNKSLQNLQRAGGLQSAQKMLDQKQNRAIEQWLDLFGEEDAPIVPGQTLSDSADATHAHVERPGSGQDRLVVYVYAGQLNNVDVLMLGMAMAREKVHGGWGKPRGIKGWEEFKNPQEREILGLIRGMARSNNSYGVYQGDHNIVINGVSGALVLELAAQHPCLFWSEDGKALGEPVRLGAPRSLSWTWHEVSQKGAREVSWQLRAEAGGARVFRNTPALYWDASQHEIGKLEAAGMHPERLEQLLKSPPIAQSAWQQHEQVMLRHLAGLPLPPFAKAPKEIKNITPQPTLSIVRVADSHLERFGLLYLTLHFAYGEVQFFSHRQGSPVLHVPSDGADKVLLHRDLELETRAISFLHQQGLQGNTQGQFFLMQVHDTDGMRWVRWADEGFLSFEQAGFRVLMEPEILDWVQRADQLKVQLRGRDQQAAPAPNQAQGDAELAEGTSPWFDLSLGIEIAGERINILPVLPALIAQLRSLQTQHRGDAADFELPEFMYVPRGEGWLRLPTQALKPWLAALLELVDPSQQIKGESLRLSRFEALRLAAALGEGVVWEGATGLKKLLAQLKGGANALQTPLLPEGLKAELRPYQLQGLSWLQFLRQQQLAGVLADDMGLGKTLQTLAHILLEKENGRLTTPALIVTPVSLLGNWQREAARFAPSLRSLVLHGAERHAAAQEMMNADIVLTPYSLLGRDKERWHSVAWSMVVLDEAQNIKNASTDVAQAAFDLPARQRICLSGTPMENHLGELWSLFHFLMPGFLGSQRQFKELYRTPIEKHGSDERLAELSRRVTPFMLRRTKKLVAQDLPDKIESLSMVTLEGKQADLYETIRLATEKAVRDALNTKGLAKSHIQVLDALLKLRQVCCDPRLVPLPAAQKVKQSAKLAHLMEILPEMLAEGRKVLLFSQFTSMLELIEQELPKHQIEWVKLTGQSTKRDAIIERFTSGQVPLFLISLKAGGVGLNLPQADTVIHYDPWWNPAVENQATDRAHRIGQTSQVFVYKLVAAGTIEERMLALQERKAQLAAGMLGAAQARKQALFTEDDIAQLLQPLGG